jgi:hypothetical protein
MEKGKTGFQVRISRRVLYTLILMSIVVGIGIGVGVYAYGTSNPSSFGHSAGEINLSEGVEGTAIFLGSIDISGDFKVGSTSVACSSANKGTIRFNSGTSKLEFCDGASWTGL